MSGQNLNLVNIRNVNAPGARADSEPRSPQRSLTSTRWSHDNADEQQRLAALRAASAAVNGLAMYDVRRVSRHNGSTESTGASGSTSPNGATGPGPATGSSNSTQSLASILQQSLSESTNNDWYSRATSRIREEIQEISNPSLSRQEMANRLVTLLKYDYGSVSSQDAGRLEGLKDYALRLLVDSVPGAKHAPDLSAMSKTELVQLWLTQQTQLSAQYPGINEDSVRGMHARAAYIMDPSISTADFVTRLNEVMQATNINGDHAVLNAMRS